MHFCMCLNITEILLLSLRFKQIQNFFFFSILYLTLDNDVSVTYFEEDTYYLENYRIYDVTSICCAKESMKRTLI